MKNRILVPKPPDRGRRACVLLGGFWAHVLFSAVPGNMLLVALTLTQLSHRRTKISTITAILVYWETKESTGAIST